MNRSGEPTTRWSKRRVATEEQHAIDNADMPQSIVAFADALGTAASAASAGTASSFLLRLQGATNSVSDRMARIGSLYKINVRWFSDSIAMSVRLDKSASLAGLLENMAYVQAAYALHGIFLRGAVASGPHHHGDHVDYGPALTEAVGLERALAGDTVRIVLSPALQAQLRAFGTARLPIVEDLDDRLFFLDFLASLDASARPPMREQIERARAAAAASKSAARKLAWLASYYNWRTQTRRPLKQALPRAFRHVVAGGDAT